MFRVAHPIKGLSKLAKLEVEAFLGICVSHLLHYKKKSVPRLSSFQSDERGTLYVGERGIFPLNRDLHLNAVPSAPSAVGCSVLHVRTVLPVAVETLFVGQAIPRFAADERRRLVGGRPNEPSRSRGRHASKALLVGI